MKNHKLPFVSVVILNYYGEKVIENVITSLQHINYPKDSYEIVVVDNNSKDKSLEILTRLSDKYKNIRVTPLNKNLGFSRGNNVGIRSAKGEYVALLNNDCIVSENWLLNLLKTAQKDPRTFAVASKILLYQKYYELNIKVPQSIEPSYSFVSKSYLYNFNDRRFYFNTYLNNGYLYAQIPYDPVSDVEIQVEIVLHIKKRLLKNPREVLTLPKNIKIINFKIQKGDLAFTLNIDLRSVKSISKIQNAGIIPFQDGYARDIGAIVRDKAQYYEYDEGQYNNESEVYAFCGAAVLMNKKILDKIGLLDETFFMYYEDVEISERARLSGYNIVYSPKAEVRHIHALSSKEGSSFFVYHVEKGRLLHVLYSFPFKVFVRQYIKVIFIVMYGFMTMLMSLKYLKAISKDKSKDKPNFGRVFQLLRVLLYFPIHLPYLFGTKRSYRTNTVNKNYQEITAGKWYFQ